MDSEVRKIQLQCLRLLNIVDDICRSNKIEYSLCGGSVVGAHLYGGCLPWDDDIDLMMTRSNYTRFLNIAKKSLPEGISLHNYQTGNDFSTPFTKIMDDNTTIVQQDGNVSGVFLDITVYDKIPLNVFAKLGDYMWMISQWVMIGKVQTPTFKHLIRNSFLSSPLGNRQRYLRFFEWVVRQISKTSKNYSYSELFGAVANTVRYSAEIFENYTEIDFENKKYMIVRDYVEYLRLRYNRTDFREPKDKQVAPHYKFVDFNLPYKEYIKNSK